MLQSILMIQLTVITRAYTRSLMYRLLKQPSAGKCLCKRENSPKRGVGGTVIQPAINGDIDLHRRSCGMPPAKANGTSLLFKRQGPRALLKPFQRPFNLLSPVHPTLAGRTRSSRAGQQERDELDPRKFLYVHACSITEEIIGATRCLWMDCDFSLGLAKPSAPSSVQEVCWVTPSQRRGLNAAASWPRYYLNAVDGPGVDIDAGFWWQVVRLAST